MSNVVDCVRILQLEVISHNIIWFSEFTIIRQAHV